MQPQATFAMPKQRVTVISTKAPEEKDVRLNNQLETQLKEMNLYETPDQIRQREEVLGELNEITTNWCTKVWKGKGMPESMVQDACPKLFTFGSYRLGVNNPGADIDTLCVFPCHLDRNDFLTSLKEMLDEAKDRVTEVVAVPQAKVPLITMVFRGITIDLTCARLRQTGLPPELNLADPKILDLAVDATDRLSLNGPRVTDTILNLVPSIENFRTVLRAIKSWAKARGIYNNALGFPGGVAWAMLTAQICQLYPVALPGTLLNRFFLVYTKWKWPNPILLTEIQRGGTCDDEVWGRTNDRSLMPVITPAYPAFNSTFNISQSTKTILLQEFQRGLQITNSIQRGEKPWSALFEKFKFFQEYKIYLRVNLLATNVEEFRRAQGFVESRIRFLIKHLDQTEGVTFAHPHTSAIDYQSPSETHEKACAFFVGLNYPDGVKSINITGAVIQFQKKIAEQKSPNTEVLVETLIKKKLPDWVFEGGVPPATTPQKRKKPAPRSPAPGAPGAAAAPPATDGTEEPPLKRAKAEPPKSPPASPPATPPPTTPSARLTSPAQPRAAPVMTPTDGAEPEPPLKKAKTETSPGTRAKPAPIKRVPTPTPNSMVLDAPEQPNTITIDCD